MVKLDKRISMNPDLLDPREVMIGRLKSKIEAFKNNFPTATLFEEDEKEVEITPDVQSPSIEKPDEMIPDMDSLPGKPMGEASSAPRDDFAIDPFDTSDYVGPKMDTDQIGRASCRERV